MGRVLNENPFEHRAHNGTVFKASRCDFIGGVDAFVPPHLSPEEIMQDAVELGAWHWANIVPQLNGFTGPGTFRIHVLAFTTDESKELLLEMPLLEFFTLESLEALGSSPGNARRVHNVLHFELEYWQGKRSVETLGAFLEKISVEDLLKTPHMGKKCLELIVQRLAMDGLRLKQK